MKRTIFLLAAMLLLHIAAFSQSATSQAAQPSKIADLLARFPAGNNAQLLENMLAIESLGEAGIEQLALLLKDQKQADNTAVSYAISGFSYYVTAPGREAARKMAAKGYYRALNKTTVVENQVFLINQLELVGKDDVTGFLLKYINTPTLSDAVVKALIKINTASARRALVNSLYNSAGQQQIRLVHAMGAIKAVEAAGYLNRLLPQAAGQLKKVTQYALSEIAVPASLPLLKNEAEKISYRFDTTYAAAYYVSYLENLLKQGYRQEADQAAFNVWKTANQPGAEKVKFAMLDILTATRGKNAVPILREAAADKDRSNRIYALNLALNYLNDREITAWAKQCREAAPEIKRDLVEMLGKTRNLLALETVSTYVNSSDPLLQTAAIKATADIGGTRAEQLLTDLLVKTSPETVQLIKRELLQLKGPGLNTSKLGVSLSKMPTSVVPVVIELIANKAAVDQWGNIRPFLNHPEATVQQAAYKAIPSLSTQQVLPELYTLLNETDNAEKLKLIQSAIINANSTIADTAVRIKNIQAALAKAPSDKKTLFYEILASIGNKDALYGLSQAFETGNEETRIAVVRALAGWKNEQAIEPLYQALTKMVNTKKFAELFSGYLSLINRSGLTGEQRLLELRRAMEIAGTTSMQAQILTETGKCKTLPALLFAGQYLGHSSLKDQAAIAVMQIAMAEENNWTGAIVEKIIEQAIPLIKGSDASYQQNALREKLAAAKKETGFLPLFNGKNLEGWKGLVENPIKRAAMSPAQLKLAQLKADTVMRAGWEAKDGLLIFKGKGSNLCTDKKYRDFELYADWKITPQGDAGIYLRGTPQVQIWDTSRTDVGAQVGSGGLYNNRKHPSIPLVMADNATNAWNSFYIKMVGEKVTVYLNGKLVVDNVVLENYWDKNLPIFPEEQIELQAHGTYVAYRDLYIREIPSAK